MSPKNVIELFEKLQTSPDIFSKSKRISSMVEIDS
jgi:hypothetical protein